MKTNNVKEKAQNILMKAGQTLAMAAVLLCSFSCTVNASGIAQNAVTAFSGELQWVVLAIMAIAALTSFAKKNYVMLGTSLIMGALVWYIVANPSVIKTYGDYFGGLIFHE